jgi:2-oxoglutarate ferredoxin oxidoreductase subunit gamma
MMDSRKEIRLSGSGGQGLILGGIILAEAALLDGINAIQSQSHGPEARGGASKAEVIISSEDIDFPKVEKPEILLALTKVAFDKYGKDIRENGMIIIDSSIDCEDIQGVKLIKVPIIKSATEVIGKSMVANIVALGVIVGATKIVSVESLEKAVLHRVPKGTEELNKKALLEGYRLAQEF